MLYNNMKTLNNQELKISLKGNFIIDIDIFLKLK